jgi:hypothetical protein
MKYYVHYGTGAGDFEVCGNLDEAIQQVKDGLSYTQCSVTITDDEDGENILAKWSWDSTIQSDDDVERAKEGYDLSDDEIVSFGGFGCYILDVHQ